MNRLFHNALLFSGSSHPELAQQISRFSGVPMGNAACESFPDGETSVQLLDSVRGLDVFVVQSIVGRPNEYLMELLVMADALKRASARSIVAVLPYYGYCRQDRKDKARVPITAKLVANLLETAGVTRVLTMDLHANQVQGFFDIPVDNLYARGAFVRSIQQLGLKSPVIVTPDSGSVKMARGYASALGVDFAIVDKRRLSSTNVEVANIIGDVDGKEVILVDDICSTGGTLVRAAELCKEKGATRVFAVVTHALMVGEACRLVEDGVIEKLIVSDTVPSRFWGECSKIHIESIAPTFGRAVQCTLTGESISSLFLSDTLASERPVLV